MKNMMEFIKKIKEWFGMGTEEKPQPAQPVTQPKGTTPKPKTPSKKKKEPSGRRKKRN